MPSVTEFAVFIAALRERRERLAERARRPRGVALGSMGPNRGRRALDADAGHLLESALGDLSDAEEELRAQNEALFEARTQLDAGAALHRSLFDLAPVAYLLTDLAAVVLRANVAACALLRVRVNAIVGAPLDGFVEPGERAVFRAALARSATAEGVEEWPLCLVPRHAAPIDCRVRVRRLRVPDAAAPSLAWIITEPAPDTFDDL
jgi:PAS domain-containing protein